MFKSSWSRFTASVFKKSLSQNSRSRRGRRVHSEQLESRVLLTAGALDSSFDSDGIVTTPVGASNDFGRSVAVQSDGKILVAGEIANGSNDDFAVVRYDVNGSLDTSFGVGGKAVLDFAGGTDNPLRVAIQNIEVNGIMEERIVLAGFVLSNDQYDFAMARFLSNGQLDTTFGNQGKQVTAVVSSTSVVFALAIQPDGKILAGGFSHSGIDNDFALARYDINGTLDPTFHNSQSPVPGIVITDLGFGGAIQSNDQGNDIILQGDKIILAGYSIVGSTRDFSAVRYLSTGEIDTTFGSFGKLTTSIAPSRDDSASGIAIDSNGRLILGGYSESGASSYFALTRYSADGVLDTTFGASGKVTTQISNGEDKISDLQIQPDGKIVAVGNVRPAGTNRFSIAVVRYNPDGSLDSSFDGDGQRTFTIGANNAVATSVVIQPDGKLLVAGYSHNGSNYDFTMLRLEGTSEPTNITLSSSAILENKPVGTTVGTLSSIDPDGLDTFSYSLVPGTGSTDNDSFTITGNALKSNAVFDYDTKSSYSIRVRTTDQKGNVFEKAFTITVDASPRVLTTSFADSGIVHVGGTTLTVTFSESVLYANDASNYELRRAGTDGLLTGNDSAITPLNVTLSGNIASLQFSAFVEDIYRLTIADSITDLSGNTLDGDSNKFAGGNWRGDFVSGAESIALNSPSGSLFDFEFAGLGMGQLVQGPTNAFDGTGRVEISSNQFSPPASIVAARRVFEAVPTVSVNIPAGIWTTVPGMSTTFVSDGTSPAHFNANVLIAGGFGVRAARFVIDGVQVATPVNGDVQVTSSGSYNSLHLDDYLMLPSGTHTVTLEVYSASASGSVDYRNASLRVELADAMPSPLIADSGRTVTSNPQSIEGLTVSREIMVPSAGVYEFTRSIVTFTNSTADVVAVPVRTVGNLGSDAATTVFATSDGDLNLEPTDWWFGTDDGNPTGGTPAVIHLLRAGKGLTPSSVSVIEDNVDWTFNLTVQPGETKRLATFTVLGNTRQQAIDAANSLATSSGFGGQAAAFLTSGEIASFANFQFNAAPTAIALTNYDVAENLPSGTVVGTFSSADPDAGDIFTYALIDSAQYADNLNFTIQGNQLKTTAQFDYETKASYSLRVRTTDQGGLTFETTITISVVDTIEDVTAPVSAVSALPATSNSVAVPISVTGTDPGGGASGVKEYDLYYSTGGAFVKFATVPAASPSTTFTGAANTTYWFRSLARDYAGNVETKTTLDTSTRIGDVSPPATQVNSATYNSSGLFTVNMTGTKPSGSAITQFDVYVSVDNSAPVLAGSTSGGMANASGVYSGSIMFQGLADGAAHTYKFYSRGRDGAGNVEAAPLVEDVSVTVAFSAVPFSAVGIDVQNGAKQRSYVRYLDVLFSEATGLDALLTAGRVKVERFDISSPSVNGTGAPVSGFVLTRVGSRLKLDFGANGIGGLRQDGNGFYRILLDMNGGGFNDAADKSFEFHRLFGDANGNGTVDVADTNLVTSQTGRSGSNLDGDLDGNLVVNSTDRLYSTQPRGTKLNDLLLGWLDD